jgi:hypothetical protein
MRMPAALVALGLVAGCSGSSATNGGAGGAGGAEGDCPLYVVPTGTDLTTPVSFTTDIMVLLNDNCSSTACHGSASAPTGGLFLGTLCAGAGDAPRVYANLVGPKSGELVSMPFVTPGDPSNSYLMHKIDGDQCHFDAECAGGSCLAAMPNGGQIMPVSRRDTVRAWITQGAQDD